MLILSKIIPPVLWCLFLIVAGGFSIRQGIVLGLLMALLVIPIGKGKPMHFTPYFVRVSPKWWEILSDFKLVNSPEEWRSIVESVDQSPAYHPLRDGILFSVVQQSEDAERILVYSHDHKGFLSEIRFREDIDPIKIRREDPAKFAGFSEHERVFVFWRPSGGGYALELYLPAWWWAKTKKICPVPIEEEEDYATGCVKLVLARLSYREFDLYWEPTKWSNNFYSRTVPQIRLRGDEQRRIHGWTAIQHEKPEFPSFLSNDWPDCIEHKYCDVEHRAI